MKINVIKYNVALIIFDHIHLSYITLTGVHFSAPHIVFDFHCCLDVKTYRNKCIVDISQWKMNMDFYWVIMYLIIYSER